MPSPHYHYTKIINIFYYTTNTFSIFSFTANIINFIIVQEVLIMIDYITVVLVLYFIFIFTIFIFRRNWKECPILQLRRFFPCVVCYFSSAIAQLNLSNQLFISSLFVGAMWIITYPLLYYFTYHKNSTDFGFHFDIVFGLYIIGWLSALKILVLHFNVFSAFL